MGLANCRRCKQPFASRSGLALCGNCLIREQNLYESYYLRLAQHFDTVLMEDTARKTPLWAERLIEALHVRLGTSKKYRHLVYWKPGLCYVCRNRQNNPESKEPVCLNCLETFFKASEAPVMETTPTGLGAAPATLEEALKIIHQLQQQLNQYHRQFGPLTTVTLHRVGSTPSPPLQQDQAARWEAKTSETLALLAQKDAEATPSAQDWQWMEHTFGLSTIKAPEKRTLFHRQCA